MEQGPSSKCPFPFFLFILNQVGFCLPQKTISPNLPAEGGSQGQRLDSRHQRRRSIRCSETRRRGVAKLPGRRGRGSPEGAWRGRQKLGWQGGTFLGPRNQTVPPVSGTLFSGGNLGGTWACHDLISEPRKLDLPFAKSLNLVVPRLTLKFAVLILELPVQKLGARCFPAPKTLDAN